MSLYEVARRPIREMPTSMIVIELAALGPRAMGYALHGIWSYGDNPNAAVDRVIALSEELDRRIPIPEVGT